MLLKLCWHHLQCITESLCCTGLSSDCVTHACQYLGCQASYSPRKMPSCCDLSNVHTCYHLATHYCWASFWDLLQNLLHTRLQILTAPQMFGTHEHYLLRHACLQTQEVQRPTVLAGHIRRLTNLVHQIGPLTGLHASVLVREALLTCTCDDTWADSQPPSTWAGQQPSKAVLQQQLGPPQQPREQQEAQQAASASVPVIVSIAEWYMTTVIKDLRGLSVSISRARYYIHSHADPWNPMS